ncbi:MAG: hypothetical protein IIB40_07750 [Candidatus Marinimicrobia bacterium]|nr:hypothetical protein [Candidatus Neomarinimicrobiota bacterium]MCH7954488.1 hypothetical protein [Candidatus Neomarinimicrobiota bacterium]
MAIFILKLFSIIAVTTLLLSGYLKFNPMGMQHALFALPTLLLIYANDILTIFYFIQTGREVKDSAEEENIEMPILAKIRKNHGTASKGATVNLLLITTGAVFAGFTVFPEWGAKTHGFVALLCSALYIKGTISSYKYLWLNSDYMNEFAERFWDKVADSPNDSGSGELE